MKDPFPAISRDWARDKGIGSQIRKKGSVFIASMPGAIQNVYEDRTVSWL